MKKTYLFSLFLGFFLVSCSQSSQEITPTKTISETDSKNELANISIDKTAVSTVEKGAKCGGKVDNIKCKSGLVCEIDLKSTDNSGICTEIGIDENIVCPATQSPVCARNKEQTNKNGYVNKCEAEKHGRSILHEGFCKVEPTARKNCESQVLGVENCNDVFVGYEFSVSSSECLEKKVIGCTAEIPFDSLEECNKTCKNIE